MLDEVEDLDDRRVGDLGRNCRSAIAIACASASPECTRPLSTTGRSLTLWSTAR